MFRSRVSQLMADRAEELRVELAGLLSDTNRPEARTTASISIKLREGYG